MAVAKVYPEPEQGKRMTSIKNIEVVSSQYINHARTVLRWTPVVADQVLAGTTPTLYFKLHVIIPHTTLMDVTTQLQRVAWAASAGARLAKSVQDWAAPQPWTITAKIAEDRLSHVARLDITTKPPLDDWGYMFGDAVHNLRAALDNALVSIAKQSGVTDEKALKKLQFPIAANDKEWTNSTHRVEGLPQGVRDKILKVQPFKLQPDGKVSPDDLLIFLRDLSNEDKHRLEITAALDPTTIEHLCSVEFETEEGAAASVPPDMTVYAPSLSDGGMLYEGRTKGRIAKIKGACTFHAQVRVRVPDGRMIGITELLAAMCQHTEQVLRSVAD